MILAYYCNLDFLVWDFLLYEYVASASYLCCKKPFLTTIAQIIDDRSRKKIESILKSYILTAKISLYEVVG